VRHPTIRTWLANPRIGAHFTPTSVSWTKLVGVWWGIIECQAIHCGTFHSVRALNTKVQTADQVLTKAHRQKISETPH
jgi:hypothetical protein